MPAFGNKKETGEALSANAEKSENDSCVEKVLLSMFVAKFGIYRWEDWVGTHTTPHDF